MVSRPTWSGWVKGADRRCVDDMPLALAKFGEKCESKGDMGAVVLVHGAVAVVHAVLSIDDVAMNGFASVAK